jgi:hypothetical protein
METLHSAIQLRGQARSEVERGTQEILQESDQGTTGAEHDRLLPQSNCLKKKKALEIPENAD